MPKKSLKGSMQSHNLQCERPPKFSKTKKKGNMHVSTMHWLTTKPQSLYIYMKCGSACAMAALPRRFGAAPAVGAATNASEATFRSAKLPENKIMMPSLWISQKLQSEKKCCWVKVISSMFSPIQVFRGFTIILQIHFSNKFVTFFKSIIDMQIKWCTCQKHAL